jgi:nitrite reductase (NO-forming)
MLTLLPTALRVRMPPRRGRIQLALLAVGVLLQLTGWIATSTPVVASGGIAYAAGALGFAGLIFTVLRIERKWSVPLAALHMIAAVAWFIAGSLGLVAALVGGPAAFDAYRSVFLTAFVGGWLVQILLGAWSYLLPMGRAGHPDERRRSLAVFEMAAAIQVVLLNAGLLLMAGRGAGWLGPGLGETGVVLAFTGAGLALAKAWLFPVLARAPVDAARARAVWG